MWGINWESYFELQNDLKKCLLIFIMSDSINKYDNTTLYKITSNDANVTDLYVGHTTNFVSRKQEHRYNCNNPHSDAYNFPLYRFMRSNGGFDGFNIAVIEVCSFSTKREAELHEGYLTNILNATLNGKMPGRSRKEYEEITKDATKAYKHQWYEENKAKIAEENTKLLECPYCNCSFQRISKSRHEKTTKHQKAVQSLSSSSSSC